MIKCFIDWTQYWFNQNKLKWCDCMLCNNNNVYVVTIKKMFVCEDIKDVENMIDETNENDYNYSGRLCLMEIKQMLSSQDYYKCCAFVHQMYKIDTMTYDIVICALRAYIKNVLNVDIDDDMLQTLYAYCEINV